jgi:biotin carboxyl carrier protein
MTKIVLDDAAWADAEEGTEALVDEWTVAVGDQVQAGQVLGTVELIKTSHEILAPAAGSVSAIRVPAQETFARGAVLIELED